MSTKKFFTTKDLKRAVINLTNEQLIGNQTSLLNLGPTRVPTNKEILFMDIVADAEPTAFDLEN